jgi:hypothetical protein
MVTKANLAIYQGDDYLAVVTVSNGTSTPPDLTGYTAQAQIRSGPADSNATVLVEISTQVNPANSTVNLTIPSAITATLSGQYAWDLELIAPDGIINTILAGSASVTPEVTRK